ncbi:protein PATRONUS 1-like [Prunus avium]|uniref:Protein PATRONUS 1-like n=1 Tax=Prunus avium TaxID=42229 RepID=A0A6P5S8A7_PRUAV|nr:protein PATRONUS 1-like [Prunus avium]
MASTIGHLFQDQNLIVHSHGASLGGKGDTFRKQRKGELGARKPLGDLSNSGKPALTQASKKQVSKEMVHDASNKKAFSKASDKVQTRSRKALSDISNSQAPLVQKKHNMKLSVVAEEAICPGAIAEERFLHNHEECIKAQTQSMDMDHFLMTLGLHKDSCKNLASPWAAPASSSQFEPESPPRYLELEEMNELEPSWLSEKLDSPPFSPKSPSFHTVSSLFSEDCDFQLI